MLKDIVELFPAVKLIALFGDWDTERIPTEMTHSLNCGNNRAQFIRKCTIFIHMTTGVFKS